MLKKLKNDLKEKLDGQLGLQENKGAANLAIKVAIAESRVESRAISIEEENVDPEISERSGRTAWMD